jgi:lactate dehydrogenase-like 2-hydroxyacid dehydrogenase
MYKALRTLQVVFPRRGLATCSASAPRHHSLAIIDDYLNTSASHFSAIPSSELSITTFNDTIVPVDGIEEARLVERLRPFDLISTIRERTTFPGSLLRQLPNLKLLLATGTQFEMFDLTAAERLGIAVVAAPGLGRTDQAGPMRPNIKKGNVHPTTQHTWAMILALARNVACDDAVLKGGAGWQSRLAIGLPGLTLGIVGLGRLGAARMGYASGMLERKLDTAQSRRNGSGSWFAHRRRPRWKQNVSGSPQRGSLQQCRRREHALRP